MKRLVMLSLLMLMSMMVCTGCVIGVKEKREMLFVSPIPIPEAARGVPVIATNEKIPLAVLGIKDAHYNQKVTGYVLVDPWFYDRLIKAYNKSR